MELCPFVNFDMCLLSNSETLLDIVLKLGTNILRHQTLCGERLHNSTYSFHVVVVVIVVLLFYSTVNIYGHVGMVS